MTRRNFLFEDYGFRESRDLMTCVARTDMNTFKREIVQRSLNDYIIGYKDSASRIKQLYPVGPQDFEVFEIENPIRRFKLEVKILSSILSERLESSASNWATKLHYLIEDYFFNNINGRDILNDNEFACVKGIELNNDFVEITCLYFPPQRR